MITHTCNKKFQFLHTAINDMCWPIHASLQPGCHWLLPHRCWNFNYCIAISRHPTPSPPSSIVIATKLYSLEPTASAGAILCVNRQSLSRGTSKHPPQAQKVLPIIVWSVVYTEVIDVCIIGLVYTEDFQISLVSLPPPCPDEALEPKGNSTDQGEIPPFPPPILQGWVWRAKASNLTPGIYCLKLTEFEH